MSICDTLSEEMKHKEKTFCLFFHEYKLDICQTQLSKVDISKICLCYHRDQSHQVISN
jgi:hypothetical protein